MLQQHLIEKSPQHRHNPALVAPFPVSFPGATARPTEASPGLSQEPPLPAQLRPRRSVAGESVSPHLTGVGRVHSR